MRPFRRELQAVFQDPYSSLNPRMRAADIVAEPIRNFESAATERSRARRVAVRQGRPASRTRWSSTRTSSRAGSASAWASRARSRRSPRLIVCDEPVSALDVSVQAQVINLLRDLQTSSACRISSSRTTCAW
jgi:ABC-type microcin C transport system duplicated ATPase subunit YejF